jgi:hypothetical protein
VAAPAATTAAIRALLLEVLIEMLCSLCRPDAKPSNSISPIDNSGLAGNCN